MFSKSHPAPDHSLMALLQSLASLDLLELDWNQPEHWKTLVPVAEALHLDWLGVIPFDQPKALFEWPSPKWATTPAALVKGDALALYATQHPQAWALFGHSDLAALLLIPLLQNKKPWGWLGFGRADPSAWHEGEIAFARSLANLLGAHQKTGEDEAQHLQLLLRFRDALSLELSLGSAIQKAVEQVAATFGYNLVSIYLREGSELVLQHQVGYSQWHQRLPLDRGISARCLRTGAAILVKDARQEKDFIYAMPEIRSQIAVPLRVGEETIGALNVESKQQLTERNLEVLQSVGAQLNLVLERARMLEQLYQSKQAEQGLLEAAQRQARRLEFMLKLHHNLSQENHLEGILRQFVEAIYQRFGHNLVAAYWLEGQTLVAKHHRGYALNHPQIPLGKGLTNRCLLSKQSLLVHNPTQDPDFLVVSDRVISAMFVPIRVREQCVGTINIESEEMRFGPEDLSLLEAAVAQLNLVLERNQAIYSLGQSEARFRTLVETLADGVLLLEPDTLRITYANPSAQKLLEAPSPESLYQKTIRDFWLPEYCGGNLERIRQLRQGQALPWIEQTLCTIAGNPLEARTSAMVLPGENPSFASVIQDYRSQKAALREVEFLAFHDPLTGLLNRRGLLREGEALLKPGAQICLLYLDFNEFKMVNDVYGHHTGDLMLKQISQRLQTLPGLWARFGGDEFVLLVSKEVVEDKQILHKLLDLFHEPLELLGQPVQVSVAVGSACFPQDAEDLMELLRAADVAMYHAKRQNQPYQFYHRELDQPIAQRLELLQALRAAIQNQKLEPYFQPIVGLASQRWQRVEVLARWRHPKRGWIAPGQFIPLAEESGRIVELDRQMLYRSLQLIGPTPLDLSCNLSPKTLLDKGFPSWLAVQLSQTGVRPGRVWLEVTESLLITHPERAVLHLRELQSLGVHIAIDDFGKGYSSLSYLKDFPVDLLKLDQTFSKEIGHSRKTEVILRGLILLGQDLGLTLLAEGVETEIQARWLREAGCDLAQGYFFSPPLPYQELLEQLDSQSS